MLAVADATEKRDEVFIRGTAPAQESIAPEELPTPEELPLPDADVPLPDPTSDPVYVPPLPEATPTPGRRGRQGLEGRGEDDPDKPSRLAGTVTLDIDPTTGLIAAPTCPVIRTRTFAIGTEPRRRCGPQYHQNQTIIPSERPRRASPP